MTLQGRVAIVTGASRGIGRAVALELARRGARVVVNYNQSAEAANEVVAAVEAGGGKARAVQADVSDFKQAEGLIKAATEAYGQLDARYAHHDDARRRLGRGGSHQSQKRLQLLESGRQGDDAQALW
jgi:NAD(P)-dependent dehydrogenase (short-subunit alcohol dehydrogenase family)